MTIKHNHHHHAMITIIVSVITIIWSENLSVASAVLEFFFSARRICFATWIQKVAGCPSKVEVVTAIRTVLTCGDHLPCDRRSLVLTWTTPGCHLPSHGPGHLSSLGAPSHGLCEAQVHLHGSQVRHRGPPSCHPLETIGIRKPFVAWEFPIWRDPHESNCILSACWWSTNRVVARPLLL